MLVPSHHCWLGGGLGVKGAPRHLAREENRESTGTVSDWRDFEILGPRRPAAGPGELVSRQSFHRRQGPSEKSTHTQRSL
jgi:hypothetical protein